MSLRQQIEDAVAFVESMSDAEAITVWKLGFLDTRFLVKRGICPNCLGNGGGWPEFPSYCGDLPCPVCNNVCDVCHGSEDTSTWCLDGLS